MSCIVDVPTESTTSDNQIFLLVLSCRCVQLHVVQVHGSEQFDLHLLSMVLHRRRDVMNCDVVLLHAWASICVVCARVVLHVGLVSDFRTRA